MKELSPPQVANFNRIAPFYRWAEYLALGTLLKRARERFLGDFTTSRNALVLGDGDGRFAAALLRHAPHLQLHAVDSSPVMLRLLKRRCDEVEAGRCTTELAVAPQVDLPGECDLVVTHFFLDCLGNEDLSTLTHRFAGQADAGLRWILSDFGVPRGLVAARLGSLYIWLLYRVFRVLTGLRVQALPHIQIALTNAGFRRLAREEQLRGFLYAELWELPPKDH